MDAEIEFIEYDRVTAVRVFLPDLGGWPFSYRAEGAAIRHPDDRHDPRIGRSLALARALRDLRRQMIREAYGRIEGSA